MKFLKLLVPALFFTTTSFSQAAGPEKKISPETKKNLSELLDMAATYLEEKEAAGFSVIRKDDSHKIIEYFNSGGDWWKRMEKLLGSDYSKPIVFKALPGESARINWLKGIPVPLMPAAALQADPQQNEKYAARIRTAYEQMRAEADRLVNTSSLAKADQRGNDAVKKMYEQQANQQALIAQMGGVEKLSQMSEAERAQAARAAIAQQTGGYSPEQLKKMTPEQQRAVARQMQQSNKTAANVSNNNRSEADEALFLEKKTIEWNAEVSAALQPVATRIKQNEQSFEERIRLLKEWTDAAEKKLPLVEDSEYGGRREGIERVLFVRDVMNYYISASKIRNDRELWEAYVNALLPVLQKLDSFTAEFEKREKLSDQMKFAVANCKMAGYETILEANRVAGFISNEAAAIQYQYNCAVLKQCDRN